MLLAFVDVVIFVLFANSFRSVISKSYLLISIAISLPPLTDRLYFASVKGLLSPLPILYSLKTWTRNLFPIDIGVPYRLQQRISVGDGHNTIKNTGGCPIHFFLGEGQLFITKIKRINKFTLVLLILLGSRKYLFRFQNLLRFYQIVNPPVLI